MKTARLCIGIISMVLFLVITLQSCAVGIGEAITGEGTDGSSSGAAVAWLLLIGGIIGVCTRKGVIGAYVTAAFYALAGLLGVTANTSIYGDLVIWGVLSLIFAAIFVLGGILTKKAIKESLSKNEDLNSNEQA